MRWFLKAAFVRFVQKLDYIGVSMGKVGNFFADLKVMLSAARLKSPPDDSFDCMAKLAEKHAITRPNAVALICEGSQVSWKELNDQANVIANSLVAQGIKPGDCVSLFMQNRIAFVACLLGINKTGATAGLINTNLTKQPLTHCINLIDSRKCIFGSEMTDSLNDVKDQLEMKDGADFLMVADGENSNLPNWAVTLNPEDDAGNIDNLPITNSITIGATAFYIFTSGTTGLPKAAIVSNKRAISGSHMAGVSLLRINHTDRMYNCLPLYHGTGLIMGLLAAFHVGASTVIRRRLSISAFWEDIRKNNCTSFIYIGELIRYLMSRPEQVNDADNPIRTIIGNGLRPDIWHQFKARFEIDRIGEFYAASEGNGGFGNILNKPCTVGLGVAPVKLVKYDVAEDEIIRDEQGCCVEVKEGDAGLLLIEITNKTKFEGYTNGEATEKKLVRNVVEEGNLYFNSGDLMKIVDVGFSFGQKHYQFVDRIGDTFRWKSENVSTNELAEIINQHPDVIFSNAYGVQIPGTDGRAGMAAIVFKEGISMGNVDLKSLSDHINESLPSYARPIFIRILTELPTTSTHKLQKNSLREEAFHLDKLDDYVLVKKPGEDCYVRLDSDFYDQIIQRTVAF
ncbi:MAG: citronellyl-CoA synthetase [Candidatus Azotimanducaceae bacterium]|jgi:citronellyl-CoA synthetase